MPERWLPVPDFEGFYEVSDLGRARSLDRIIYLANGTYTCYGQILIPNLIDTGYLQVSFQRQGVKRKYYRLHRLVLLVFVGPCPVGMEGRHLDGIKTNCALYNLRYGTHIENVEDQLTHETHPAIRFGEIDRCPRLHLLEVPNLVENHHSRKCLSCARAMGRRGSLRRQGKPEPNMQLLSDEIYESLGFVRVEL